MKNYNKLLVLLLAAGGLTSCADTDVKDFKVDKPEGIEYMEELNSFDHIKTYLDRAQYPNLKLGCAVTAEDYNNKNVWYRVANANFDEVTIGDVMNHASIVSDEGTMDFGAITEFLDNAEAAGVDVFGHYLFGNTQQNGTYLKTLLADLEIPIGPDDRIEDFLQTYTEYTEYPFTVQKNFKPTIVDGILKASCSNKNHKFYLTEKVPVTEGEEYEIIMMVRANKEASITFEFSKEKNNGKVNVTGDWTAVKLKLPAKSTNGYVLVDPGNLKIDLEFEYVSIGHYPPSSRPLTDEEKVANITEAAETYIAGMMEACAGRVKVWNLINEPLSDNINDDGIYDLKHGAATATDFYWQDYLGDDTYASVLDKAARASFAEFGGNASDLKLFVSESFDLASYSPDYAFKLESLAAWVSTWEKKGAKIDGITADIHVSYCESTSRMQKMGAAVVEMLHKLAATGKAVRISGFNMGYEDEYGDDLKADALSKEQMQNMANFYQFIMQMYLKIIPQDQQYGITFSGLVDASAKEGSTPKGLWDAKWNRKAAYTGVCFGLSNPAASTENFFEYLQANGLTHYIAPEEDEE